MKLIHLSLIIVVFCLATEVLTTPGAIHQRFEVALEFLKKQPGVDPDRIVVIGYCFGGRVALENARRGLRVAGIFTLHGILDTDEPAKPGTIRSPIHVFTGAADPMVNDEAALKFTREMLTAGAPFTLTSYPCVQHSFTNPEATAKGRKFNMPLAFDSDAAHDSWRVITAFLEKMK
jgi:dienelactone hydrolase